MAAETIEGRVDNLLRGLFLPENRALLERYRIPASNRVYRIPLDPPSKEFIVVKLLPSWWSMQCRNVRWHLRNFMNREHTAYITRDSVLTEIERFREWQMEGISVPPLIETTLPGFRVFQGLNYPTLTTILKDQSIAPGHKLEVLRVVTRALSLQHKIAKQKGRKTLLHGEPGPQNIMFDMDKGVVYWFDLEGPVDPKTSLEGLMVREIRIFLFGVTYPLWEHFDEAVEAFCQNYEFDYILWQFVRRMEKRRASPVRRSIEILRRRFPDEMLRKQIGPKLRECLEKKVLALERKHNYPLATLDNKRKVGPGKVLSDEEIV